MQQQNQQESLNMDADLPQAVANDGEDRFITSQKEDRIDMNFTDNTTENDPLTNGDLSPFAQTEFDGPTPESVDGLEDGLTSVDVNAYQHKKTLAQGMMDLALLSANANQLRYVIESYDRHPYFYPSLIFIILSIGFQVAVGVGLILNSRYNIEDKKEVCHANKVNNYTIIGIFIITVINVFISSFGVAETPQVQRN